MLCLYYMLGFSVKLRSALSQFFETFTVTSSIHLVGELLPLYLHAYDIPGGNHVKRSFSPGNHICIHDFFCPFCLAIVKISCTFFISSLTNSHSLPSFFSLYLLPVWEYLFSYLRLSIAGRPGVQVVNLEYYKGEDRGFAFPYEVCYTIQGHQL